VRREQIDQGSNRFGQDPEHRLPCSSARITASSPLILVLDLSGSRGGESRLHRAFAFRSSFAHPSFVFFEGHGVGGASIYLGAASIELDIPLVFAGSRRQRIGFIFHVGA
jgi:hypothetical protein